MCGNGTDGLKQAQPAQPSYKYLLVRVLQQCESKIVKDPEMILGELSHVQTLHDEGCRLLKLGHLLWSFIGQVLDNSQSDLKLWA